MNVNAHELRQIAFAVAYRMLGDAGNAEDIAQNCAVKILSIHWPDINNAHAYIAKMATRDALNFLREQKTREHYTRKYALPLPYLAEYSSDVETRLDLSYGIIALTQNLTPLSRAVFILRSAFELSYAEIAETLGRTPDACRQAYARGKKKIQRGKILKNNTPASAHMINELSSLIIAGDLPKLVEVLAQDIIFHSDGGGVAPALARPLTGAEPIAQFLIASPRLLKQGACFDVIDMPQGALLLAQKDDDLLLMVIGEIADKKISALYAISDPIKLRRLQLQLSL